MMQSFLYWHWRVKHALALASEKTLFAVAWLMPRTLVYFCAIRVVAFATQGKYSGQVVGELRPMDAIQRWERA